VGAEKLYLVQELCQNENDPYKVKRYPVCFELLLSILGDPRMRSEWSTFGARVTARMGYTNGKSAEPIILKYHAPIPTGCKSILSKSLGGSGQHSPVDERPGRTIGSPINAG
jgi:hypothetical protein